MYRRTDFRPPRHRSWYRTIFKLLNKDSYSDFLATLCLYMHTNNPQYWRLLAVCMKATVGAVDTNISVYLI